jgi:hypothetical protein
MTLPATIALKSFFGGSRHRWKNAGGEVVQRQLHTNPLEGEKR